MPRIRTIKPEFPQSESVGRVSREARLLFILLITGADDYGRLRAAPVFIARHLYPYDDDAPALVPRWLDELEREGFISRYEVEGSRYLQIMGWAKHQRVDNAGKSSIPAPNEEVRREPPRTAATCGDSPLDLDLGPRTSKPTKDQDLGPKIAPSRKREAAVVLPPEWVPSEAETKFALEMGLTPDEAAREAIKFRAYWVNGKGGGTRRKPSGWASTWQNWISRTADNLPRGNGNEPKPTRPNRFDASSPEAVRQRRLEIAEGLGLGLPGQRGTDNRGAGEDAP